MSVVVSPSNFNPLKRGAPQRGEEDGVDACTYEEAYVSGAVVPFSWEVKPGIPLMEHTEAMKGQRECDLRPHGEEVLMSNPLNHMEVKGSMCESTTKEKKAIVLTPSKPTTNMLFRSNEEKALAHTQSKHSSNEEQALALIPSKQSTSSYMLFPLPPPPNTSLQKPTINVGASSTPPPHDHSKSPSSTNTHITKHRASSFPPFLNMNKSATTSSPSNGVGKPYAVKDDPFLRAIQACTTNESSKVVGNNNNTRLEDGKSFNIVGSTKNSRSATCNDMGSQIHKNPHSIHKNSDNILAMAKDAGNGAIKIAVAEDADRKGVRDSYGAMKAPLRRLTTEMESNSNGGMKAKLQYTGHPAFMVAGLQQQQSAKKKPVVPSIKANAHHHRSASYGCLSCRSADNHHDSIVRIHNPR